jgi:glycosyltransferase involved in cell wall biosynthesis
LKRTEAAHSQNALSPFAISLSKLALLHLKVALVHYHLRTGGVSRVVATQSAVLTAAGIEHLILSSGPQRDGLPQAIIPELDYTSEALISPEALYQKLQAACQRQLGSVPDVWHFHNPTLGKNILFPEVIARLARTDAALILQLHDFAEDNRPENYPLLKTEEIYPLAPRVHYAFLNRRDQTALQTAGLSREQSHLLPNLIQLPPQKPLEQTPEPSGETIVLYPVRGIRRKNLGEVLLLAALAPRGTQFAISLAPENEQWQEIHQFWEDLAHELKLPVRFDVTDREPPVSGAKCDFPSWQRHATHFLTTSVAEGFGLTFLEPIALQKPLLGRDLPEITDDFRADGIHHPHLYESLSIGLEFIDENQLRTALTEKLTSLYQQYNQPLNEHQIATAWNHLTRDGTVDFGNLPEDMQETLIRKITAAPEPPEPFLALKNQLTKNLTARTSAVSRDRLQPYTPAHSPNQLLELYRKALSSPKQPPHHLRWLPKGEVLAQFLQPERFHFLRSS